MLQISASSLFELNGYLRLDFHTLDSSSTVSTHFTLVQTEWMLSIALKRPKEALPRTQGKIIHSTMVGGGPCTWRSVCTICCEARRRRKRKVRYEAVWQMNLMKGFLMKVPRVLFGARRYMREKTGKSRPMMKQVTSFTAQWRRLHPGNPSYHSVARSCWQLGWATNWENIIIVEWSNMPVKFMTNTDKDSIQYLA